MLVLGIRQDVAMMLTSRMVARLGGRGSMVVVVVMVMMVGGLGSIDVGR